MSLFFEWGGALFGIAGAALLSSNVRLSPYGWLLFLCSSLLMSGYAIQIQAWGVLALNVCFVATNVNGIVRCWLPFYRATKAANANAATQASQ